MIMNSHRLKENPFYKLHAVPQDSDRELVARATDIRLLTGEDMHEALETLLKPQGRLEAEIDYLPGTDEAEILKLRGMMEQSRKQMTFSDIKAKLFENGRAAFSGKESGPKTFRPGSMLALLNGAAAMLEAWSMADAQSAAAAALAIARIIGRVDVSPVVEQINEDRKAGGRELLESEGEAAFRLREHKRAVLGMVCDRIISLPEAEEYKAEEKLTDAYCDEQGEYSRHPALDEIVSVHLGRHHVGAAAMARDRIMKLIEAYTDYTQKNPVRLVMVGRESVSSARVQNRVRETMVTELTEQLYKWDRETCLPRRITQVKGYTQKDSYTLFSAVHSFFADMVNRHHDMENARKLIRTLQNVFRDLSKEDRYLIDKNAETVHA